MVIRLQYTSYPLSTEIESGENGDFQEESPICIHLSLVFKI